MTIIDAILDRAGGPGTLTVIDSHLTVQEEITWARLHDKARRTASVLAGAGAGPGGRVALLGGSSADLVTALQAVWLCGAAVTVLPAPNGPAPAYRLAPALADARPDLLIVAADALTTARTAWPGATSITIPELVRRAAFVPRYPMRRPDPADLAILQYTSGRRKDVLFAAGRNLYPQDIEAAAGRVPGVRVGGAVAFGLPGEEGDRLIVAVESRTCDQPRLCRAVAAAVSAETGMRPTLVIALPPGRLPRTTSGKLRRAEASRRYRDGELDRPPRQVTAPERTGPWLSS